MRLEVREDVAAPVGRVWAAAADMAGWERQALRRGAQVSRLGPPGPPGPGAAWRVAFAWRGRDRVVTTAVSRWEPPNAAGARWEGGGLAGTVALDLLALGPATTRLTLRVEVEARAMGARLLLQSMRLARGMLERRLAERVGAWARGIDGRPGAKPRR